MLDPLVVASPDRGGESLRLSRLIGIPQEFE